MINKKAKTLLKEKDIVDYIVLNWSKYFNGNMFFYKKEHRVTPKWRCDILGYKFEIVDNNKIKVPIYIEVKYNNNHRDLIYEFAKGKDILNNRKSKYNNYLMLIIDRKSLDNTIVNYLEENKITYYVYELENDDLNTLTLHCVESFL